jgi:hypothetical protein
MSRTRIDAALSDLLFTPGLPLAEALDRHFAPDYRQRTDGEWADRAGFAEHIAHLRTVVEGGRIEVHDELTDGTRYADRHTVHLRKLDGTAASIEVYLFAELAPDGRFRRIEETTLLLDGGEGDRDLGSARA